MFKIFTTEEFDRKFRKLDVSLQIQIKKEIGQLEVNPYVGKPLGYEFFREKRFDGKRLYYLVYENFCVALLLGMGDKKAQQSTINKILAHILEYQELVISRLKN